jgi:glycosyltransferase involved in cell wall biosynthesis
MKSKVSIVMVVLNGEKYIAEALDSIAAQTYTNYELVLVDDGSTDRTPEIVNQRRDRMEIRYIRHSANHGITRSINDGIRACTGDYITFLDHDDAWFPHMLSTQVGYMEAHPGAGMVHADFQTIDPKGNIIEPSVAVCRQRKRPDGEALRELFQESHVVANTAVVRKSVMDEMKGYDERLYWGDYHLWMRIALRYPIGYSPLVLAKYRQHPSQSTRTYSTERPDKDSVAMQAIKLLLDEHPEARRRLGEKTIRRRMASLYYEMAYAWLWQGMRSHSRICLRRAISLWPSKLGYYVTYLASFLSQPQAAAVRKGWHWFRGLFVSRRRQNEQVNRALGTSPRPGAIA